jgi:hypothetical protein
VQNIHEILVAATKLLPAQVLVRCLLVCRHLVHQLKPSALVVAAQQALAVLVDAAHTRQRSEKLRTNAASLQHRNLRQQQLSQSNCQQVHKLATKPCMCIQCLWMLRTRDSAAKNSGPTRPACSTATCAAAIGTVDRQ